jgi:16S rRNA (adenine1518-N6/adenine1519-N6)-dimethyltransferase
MWTKTSLRHALLAKGLKPRKGRGQHFLVDPNLCRAIVASAALPPDADVLEIGCGPGLLTAHLAPAAGRVTAVEIDADLAALCREALADAAHVDVVVQDILDAGGGIALTTDGPSRPAPLHVFGNLPYNRAVDILVALLDWDRPVVQIRTLVQREVAERMVAPPRGEQYGPLSVVAQAFAEVKLLRGVSPSVFWPAPRVESAIVRLVPRPGAAGRVRLAWAGLRRLFQGRRKGLGNVMKGMGLGEGAIRGMVESMGIPAKARAEGLAPEVLARLAIEVNRLSGEI